MEDRQALVRRGLLLNYVTIAYNTLEAVVAIATGVASGSVALLGFGVDSVIEVTASGAAQWRLRADMDLERRERVELLTHRVVGWSFVALAVYVVYDSATTLWRREEPAHSAIGFGLLVLSAIVMPALARKKRRIARSLSSDALESEARQTSLCAYLSVIALTGVALNSIASWWWADPVAALGMAPIILKEGMEGIRARPCSDCAT
jgi:divalent metal cation (Fe/Co/Zn/Cd) transporter